MNTVYNEIVQEYGFEATTLPYRKPMLTVSQCQSLLGKYGKDKSHAIVLRYFSLWGN